MKIKKPDLSFCLLTALIVFASGALAADKIEADATRQLRPDGKSADQTKKVSVFILMGQSNMVGMGDIDPGDKPAHSPRSRSRRRSIPSSWMTRASGRCERTSITTMPAPSAAAHSPPLPTAAPSGRNSASAS